MPDAITETVNPQSALDSMSAAQLSEWKNTGKTPAFEKTTEGADSSTAKTDKPNKADSATATNDPTEKETSKPAADSEAASTESSGKAETDKRVQELLADRKKARMEAEELRAKVAAFEAKKDAKVADPSPAAQKRTKPTQYDLTDKGELKYPDQESFFEALADFKAEEKFEQKEAERVAAEQKVANEKASIEFWQKFQKDGEGIDDFDAITGDPKLNIPPGSLVNRFVDKSPLPGKLVYYLGKHQDELAAIHKMEPTDQMRALTKIELSLTPPPKEETSTPKKPVIAFKPGSEVGARGTTAKDDAAEALKDGNFAAYKRIEDAKDLARLKS